MSWAQRLKRVFNIDVNACGHCGGRLRIVASIEEPTAIRAILAHFAKHGAPQCLPSRSERPMTWRSVTVGFGSESPMKASPSAASPKA